MKKNYKFEDFIKDNAWLIFRMDAFIADKALDVYAVMHLPSGMILNHQIAVNELLEMQVDELITEALDEADDVPRLILLASHDPIESFLRKSVEKMGVKIETAPVACFEGLTEEIKLSFAEEFGYPTIGLNDNENEEIDESEYECARRSIPDSYELCSCASGLKYKFCCKRMFGEIGKAMVEAEEGNIKEALEWIAKARKLVGNTAEVLCREAIVYSFFDPKKSQECLKKCMEANPKHPRAHYLRGIDLTNEGDFQGAIKAYEKAISYYPATDHYHLNEVNNNMGCLYYRMGDFAKAKKAWGLALQYLPSDKVTKRNLFELFGNSE